MKGVSTGQVRFLRGLIRYQRDEIALAIEELQQAAELMPESVACQALLARVLLHGTYYSRYGTSLKSYAALDKMVRLTPTTPEDFLFRGLAFAAMHTEAEALVDLDKAIQQRDSAIARAIRGYALNLLAVDGGSLALSQRAQADLRRAKILLPDNPFVRTTNLIVHLTAANLYGEAGRASEQQAALNESQDDADALKSSPIIRCVRYRVIYYEQVGDEGTAIEILRQATDQQGTGELLSRYALALYRQGKIGEALEALDRRRESDDVANEFLRVVLLADHPEHGPDQAYSSFLDLVNRYQDEIGTPSGYWNSAGTLLLLGKRGEAAMSQLDDLPSFVFPEASINARPLAEYVAENRSEEGFLENAGDSRIRLCANHYWIGLVRLSEGDRQGAREHFEKSVAHGIYFNRFDPYSRTYLERLKQDPAWPRWIPAKKE